MDDFVTVELELVLKTDRAAKFLDEDGDEIWLPLSKIENWNKTGRVTWEIDIPEWLAEEKGLA